MFLTGAARPLNKYSSLAARPGSWGESDSAQGSGFRPSTQKADVEAWIRADRREQKEFRRQEKRRRLEQAERNRQLQKAEQTQRAAERAAERRGGNRHASQSSSIKR